MSLQSGEPEPHVPEELSVAWDLNRKAPDEDKDWYREVVEHSHDLLCVHNLDGRLLAVNSIPARLLGYSVEELLRIPMREIIDPAFRERFDLYLQEIERNGEFQGLLAVMTRSGQRRLWEYHNTLRRSTKGAPVVWGIAHDVTEMVEAERALRASNERLLQLTRQQSEIITERKQAAKLLEESEKRFRAVYEKSPLGICLVESSTGRFLHANPKFCEITGRTEQDLLSRDFYSITHPDDLAANRITAVRLAKGELSSYDIEKRYVLPDGSIRWINATAVSVPGDGAEMPRAIAIVQDITERRETREALRLSDVHLLEAQRVAHMGIWRLDFRTQEVLGSEQMYRIFGIDLKSGPRFFSDLSRFFPRDSWQAIVEFNGKASHTGKPEDIEIDFLRPDGTKGWILARSETDLDDAGNVIGMHGIALDITERKRTEQALRQSEERLRMAQEAAQIGMFERNLLTGDNTWSPQMEAIYGLAPNTWPRTSEAFVRLVHPDDRPQVSRWMAESVESGEGKGEWRVVWPDGSVRWISGRWCVFKDAEGRPARVIGMDFDITERKETEEALRKSEERFRVALKNSPIAVFNQDRDLRYTWIGNSQLPFSASEKTGKTLNELFDSEEAARITRVRRLVLETGIGARDETQFTFGGRKHYFDTTIEPLLDSSGNVIGITGASAEITDLREVTEALRAAKERLTEEKLYLEQEIDTELGFGEIVGQSRALRYVMKLAGTVASSDAAVLLLGETGTGKELVARGIHRLSRRSEATFIKLNCAAIPSGLVESELFGHEKGAFTGAVNTKAGRVELADKGTLFLDEIGEIPLELQPKLLRVLQDREFERLGGTRTFKVDFRLIAATNRDLANSVRENEFRSDLYYRLNVFPIRIPPLRERREDIQMLVEYFVQKFARRMNKSISSIPRKTLEALRNWEWPGNIRELENFIERSVILTHGSVLVAPLSELVQFSSGASVMDETLAATEREHILRALQDSHGQIGGVRGAAARLGLRRTTLQSKLKHLGIHPHSGSREH